MKCDKCGSPHVTAKIMIQKEDGEGQEELNLCSDCFEKFAKEHPEVKQGLNINANNFLNLLMTSINNLNNASGLHNLNQNNSDKGATKPKPILVCSRCKTTLKNLKDNGKVGCQNCYKVFHKQIDKILLKISGENSETMKEIVVDNQQKIAVLKLELTKAIKTEEFEIAAKLRDDIMELEDKENKNN